MHKRGFREKNIPALRTLPFVNPVPTDYKPDKPAKKKKKIPKRRLYSAARYGPDQNTGR